MEISKLVITRAVTSRYSVVFRTWSVCFNLSRFYPVCFERGKTDYVFPSVHFSLSPFYSPPLPIRLDSFTRNNFSPTFVQTHHHALLHKGLFCERPIRVSWESSRLLDYYSYVAEGIDIRVCSVFWNVRLLFRNPVLSKELGCRIFHVLRSLLQFSLCLYYVLPCITLQIPILTLQHNPGVWYLL